MATNDDTATTSDRDWVEVLGPWFEAMCDQQTVWARTFNVVGELVDDWFAAVVVELRRPSPYNIESGMVGVRRLDGDRGVLYVFSPDSQNLSLERPAA